MNLTVSIPCIREMDVSFLGPNLVRSSVIGGVAFDGFKGFDIFHGGIWLEPTPSILSLHALDDAREGTSPQNFAVFELEKSLRMLLRQSPLALRIFASPVLTSTPNWEPVELEALVNDALSCRMVDNLLALSRSAIDRHAKQTDRSRTWALDALRWSLAARALTEGFVEFHLDRLIDRFGLTIDGIDEESLCRYVDQTQDRARELRTRLPAGPRDYDRLSAWLVDRRREAF